MSKKKVLPVFSRRSLLNKEPLIRTTHKSKLAKGLTHSLGAEVISQLLEGIKLYDELSISFHKEIGNKMGLFVPGWTHQQMKGHSTDLLKFRRIVHTSYSTPLDKWHIIVHPVEREQNKQVKQFLMEIGFPLLRKWLATERTETWFTGRHHFLIGLDEQVQEYCIWETHKDRTIHKETNRIVYLDKTI